MGTVIVKKGIMEAGPVPLAHLPLSVPRCHVSCAGVAENLRVDRSSNSHEYLFHEYFLPHIPCLLLPYIR